MTDCPPRPPDRRCVSDTPRAADITADADHFEKGHVRVRRGADEGREVHAYRVIRISRCSGYHRVARTARRGKTRVAK